MNIIKKYLLGIISLIIIFYYSITSIYNLGYNAGVSKISLERDQERIEYSAKIDSLQRDYNKQLQLYINKNTKILMELNNIKAKHEKDIININNSYINKLHESEARASIYKRMSESGGSSRDLAGITSRLDKSLTEGRYLVKELSTSIRLRDDYISKLIEQHKNDIKLLEGTNGTK